MSKKILNGINVTGGSTFNTVSDAGVNTNKFLVLNSSNLLAYRTSSELLSDLSAASSGTILSINGTSYDISTNRSWSVGTVTSVAISMPSAFNVSGPVTGSGTISITGAGTTAQYIRGDGTLATYNPGAGGGGASQAFYFNGGVASGVTGYQQMSTTANTGSSADFNISSNGYIASFLTDSGSPNQLLIPAGNWNFEIYMQSSSTGGSPYFYVELYKYNGSFTLIATSSGNPEYITNGTAVDLYTTALSVPTTTLALTDRLAVRVYVVTAGRTITMHTQNNNLSEVITTFTTGITALNGLTAQVQNFATGTSGSDFNISSSTSTHTFNIPTASSSNRGALSSADWTTFNSKIGGSGATNYLAKFTASGTIGSSIIYDNGNGIGINTSSPYVSTTYSLDINGGLLVKNTGRTASITVINADPSAGGNNAFGVWSVGGTSGTSYVDFQGYYGASVVGSTLIRLNYSGGGVLVGSLSGTGTRMVVADSTGTLSTQSIPSTGVTSFNTRTGAVTLSSSDVTTALGFTPYNSTNPSAYISLTSLSGSAPITYNTSTGAISITQASTSTNGYLSSTDWNTFNGKQAALSGTGFVKISGTTISYDNSTYYLASNPSGYITSSALSSYLPLAGGTLTGIFYSTYVTATGLSNGSFNVAKTVYGNIHINNGAGPANNNGNQGAITWQGDGGIPQAGIYVSNNSSYGTAMGFATTDSYATGPQLFMTATNAGQVNFPRARPSYAGNTILDAGNYSSYALPLSGGTIGGTLTINTPSNAVGSALEIYSTGYHQYPQIYSNGNLEAMWNFKNSNAQWYAGLRTSSQLVGTTGFHFYNTTSGQTVGGWDVSGNLYAIGTISASNISQNADAAATIVQRNSSGYVFARYFNTTVGGTENNTSGLSYVAGFNGTDTYIRSYSSAAVASMIGLSNYLPLGGGYLTGQLVGIVPTGYPSTTKNIGGMPFVANSISVTQNDDTFYPLISCYSVVSGQGYYNYPAFGFMRPTTNINGDVVISNRGDGLGTLYWKFKPNGDLTIPGSFNGNTVVANSTITFNNSGSYPANLGQIGASWAGSSYPTLYGSNADRWVMHINPHISYTQPGYNGFSGSMTGATIRMASDPAATYYWDIGPGTSGVGTDKFSIGRNATSFFNISNSGNAVFSGSVSASSFSGSIAWSNVSSKPAAWLDATNLTVSNAPNTTAVSGFYNDYAGSGNPVGTWFSYVNVRHENPTNVYGHQHGMSFYDNHFWFRSYAGGSYQSWARALDTISDAYPSNMNQYVRTSDYVTFNNLTVSTSGTASDWYVNGGWFRVYGSTGLYFNDYGYGLCAPARQGASYGNVCTYGNNSWNGYSIYDNTGNISSFMANGGNFGIYGQSIGKWAFYYSTSTASYAIGSSSPVSGYTLYLIYGLYTVGLYNASDARMKKDIASLSNSLDKVKALRGVSYEYIDKGDGTKHQGTELGFIAQEVEPIVPELVRYDEEKGYAMNYNGVSALLVEAIKEQQAQIDFLTLQLNNLLNK